MTRTPAETAPAEMDLGFTGQRAYCTQLGIIPADRADVLDAWYREPACQEVSQLLGKMETQRRKMTGAAQWMRDTLNRADQRFAGQHVHSANLNSSGEVARYALEYDMAVAAYCALEDQLRHLVYRIRRDQGYEPDAFTRLEDHPELSPADDKAVRDLRALRKHLTDQGTYTPGAQRRHLRDDHGIKATPQTGPAPRLLHEQAHADELAALAAQVAIISAQLAANGGEQR